jgi:hypothetical protein
MRLVAKTGKLRTIQNKNIVQVLFCCLQNIHADSLYHLTGIIKRGYYSLRTHPGLSAQMVWSPVSQRGGLQCGYFFSISCCLF